jgi:hypothetical protein
VDELSMRASAERVSGRELGWFFQQWVHRTGLVDYALGSVHTERAGDEWVTRARVVRRGEYDHPMPVGARTSAGWTIVRADSLRRDQWVELRTAERPAEVRVDPLHSTEDWDRRNDLHGRPTMYTFDWPFLAQTDRDRDLVAIRPKLWYTGPGGLTAAVRFRSNYASVGDVGWDERELGIAVAARVPAGAPAIERLQGWLTVANPRLPFAARPLAGVSAGAWVLDGITKLELAKQWDLSPFLYSNGPDRRLRLAFDATLPYDGAWTDSARWDPARVYDASAEYAWRSRLPGTLRARVKGMAGLVDATGQGGADAFARIEGEVAHTGAFGAGREVTHHLRLFAGATHDAPRQRSIGLVSLDPTETFSDDFLRGRNALFARPDVHYSVPGGAGLRGYSPALRVGAVAALNGELAFGVVKASSRALRPEVQLTAFGDGAWGKPSDISGGHLFADAGVGLVARDQLWDRRVVVRFDVPLYVRDPALAPGGAPGDDRVMLRWTFSFADLW